MWLPHHDASLTLPPRAASPYTYEKSQKKTPKGALKIDVVFETSNKDEFGVKSRVVEISMHFGLHKLPIFV